MDVTTSHKNNCVVITIGGKVVCGPDAPSLFKKMHKFMEEGLINLIVGLRRCEGLKSSGLDASVDVLNISRRAGSCSVLRSEGIN